MKKVTIILKYVYTCVCMHIIICVILLGAKQDSACTWQILALSSSKACEHVLK